MSYSAFFSNGLLASSQHTPPPSPGASRPDSPMIIPRTPSINTSDLTDEDSTPIAIGNYESSLAVASGERPKLRKRKSSLTVGTSPLVHIKSSMRSANAAAQKQSFISRSRSSSINEATDGNSLMGRLRSGSVGTALRSRRILKKQLPPPNMPLPPLPVLSFPATSTPPDGLFDIPASPSTPRRRPFMTRSSTYDNYDQAIPSSPISAPFANEFPGLISKTSANDADMMKDN